MIACYDELLRFTRVPAVVRARLALALGLAVALSAAAPAGQGQATTYTVISAQNRRPLAVRSQGNTDIVALDQLAPVFDLTATEDAVVGGLTINARGQRILVIPGQNFAQVNGRVLSLSAPITRDRNGMYQLPIDFVSVALARALNTRIEVRKASRLIIIGDVAVPRVAIHVERQANAARVTFEIEPTAPHRVTREGNSIIIRFDAAALDMAPATGQAPEFLKSVRVQGTTVYLDLGPQTAVFTNQDDRDQTHLTVELQPTPPPPPPTPAAGGVPAGRPGGPPQEAPLPDFSHLGGLHTIVIDPGHGGDDRACRVPAARRRRT